jgi:DNA-binding winged helix-turn-helix (wHTH) protein/tetratricopeptide (TPR) repeat protein
MVDQAAFQINGRTVHPSTGDIEGPQGTKHLEPRVMDLLSYLAKNSGSVVSREDIIRHVWRGTQVTDDVITRSVSQLRRALTDDWRTTPVIETIPKRGYRLVPTVDSAPPTEIAPSIAPAAVPSVHSPESSISSYRIPIVVFLVLGALLSVALLHRRSVEPPAAATAAAPTSLLIVPFSAEKDSSGHLAEDLDNELIDRLAGIAGIRVIGPTSSLQLSRSGKSALQAAREMNVSTVVTGAIHVDESQMRISVSMLDALSGRVLHGHDYQFPNGGLIDAGLQIAKDMAGALGASNLEARAPIEVPSSSPEAYQLYLEARSYIAKNQAGALQQGGEFLRQAIKLDPNFADAHAALAIALALQVDFANRSVREVATEAQQQIDEARTLSPKLATAHAAQGLLYLYEGRFDDSEKALREATALRPNYAQAHIWLGLVAQSRWQIERSVASFGRALDIEPLSSIAALNLSRSLDMGGSYQRAEAAAREALRLHPEFDNLHWSLGHILWCEGELTEAENEYTKAVHGSIDIASLYGQMALLQIDLGHEDRASEWIVRGERLQHDDDMIWLARTMNALLGRDTVAPLLAIDHHIATPSPYQAAAAASLNFYRGKFDSARRGFARLHEFAEVQNEVIQSRWLALAGHSPALDEAAANILGDDPKTGQALLSKFAEFLAGLRASGLDSPGIDYEEAAINSLQGNVPMAIAKLAAARQHGWREEWFLMRDPKLAALAR